MQYSWQQTPNETGLNAVTSITSVFTPKTSFSFVLMLP
jgi:hypothetical protein